MRVEQKMKLIDFDASVSYTDYKESTCTKYSSGYLPPELIHCDDFKVCVKSSAGFDTITDESFQPTSNALFYQSASLSDDSEEKRIPFFLSRGVSYNNSRRSSFSLSDDEEQEIEVDHSHITYCDDKQDGFFGFEPVPPSPSQVSAIEELNSILCVNIPLRAPYFC